MRPFSTAKDGSKKPELNIVLPLHLCLHRRLILLLVLGQPHDMCRSTARTSATTWATLTSASRMPNVSAMAITLLLINTEFSVLSFCFVGGGGRGFDVFRHQYHRSNYSSDVGWIRSALAAKNELHVGLCGQRWRKYQRCCVGNSEPLPDRDLAVVVRLHNR